ncbi:RagB/SusD family nutrient uptake outer membrane protein [Psychroflexus sediminis]|uniref:SusD family protein n=1 Tax=Psychroflexus sediminis TaxID=470826 RepID=A0A1G7U372_9FLAO|nr:RagB/SusD family nutrient uptake outer membrane protein [Psychroflexus sediminis]SDG41818.1 SusD family protein [Psychroflexus sediminis]
MKNIKFLYILILTGFVMTSCSDAYEVEPDDEVLEENALNTINDLERGLIGAYSAVSGSNVIGYSSRFTDDLKIAASNRGQGIQVFTWSIVASTNEPAGIWNNIYRVINRVNRLIEASDRIVTENDADIARKNRILGECYALRALSHFDLYRMFSQSYELNALSIPIVDRVFVFDQPSRNTVEEVLNFIEADLIEAESRLDLMPDSNEFMSGLAAKALRARLALYAGNYEQAVALSTQVINNSTIATTRTDYLGIWNDTYNEEVLFKLSRNAGEGRIGTLFTDTNGDIFFNVSLELYGELNAGDYRNGVIVDFDNSESLDNLIVGKYLGTDANPGLNDIKLLRTSEQYLIRAEANLRKQNPDLEAAAIDMETLKNARNDNVIPREDYADVADGLNDILNERRFELAYEGHRMFDLKRYDLGVSRLDEDCDNAAGACDLESDSHLFALPIPQQEIFANENIEQNRNY